MTAQYLRPFINTAQSLDFIRRPENIELMIAKDCLSDRLLAHFCSLKP